MKINLDGVDFDNYIKPGIYENVEIKGVKDDSAADIDFPYILFTFEIKTNEKDKEKKIVKTERFPMYKDSAKFKDPVTDSLEKIKHICLALLPMGIINEIKCTEDLDMYLKGKKLRLKYIAFEYVDKNNGEKKTWVGLPKYKFAESIDVEPSKLKWIEERDYKKMKIPQ